MWKSKTFRTWFLSIYYIVVLAYLYALYLKCSTSQATISTSRSQSLSRAVRAADDAPLHKPKKGNKPFSPTRLINIPPLPNGLSWRELISDKGLNKTEILETLTKTIQNQLEYLGTQASCSGYTLHCGYPKELGLGWQLHHRSLCLAVSYTMGIPLIHDAKTGWPSDTPWEHVYKRLGSNCSVNEKTIFFEWREGAAPILHLDRNCTSYPKGCPIDKQFEYPFLYGIPVPKELLDILMESHNEPVLWFRGQFLKHATRPSLKMERIITEAAAAMAFQDSPHVVGVHVRRTDKISETVYSHHEIWEYMNWAGRYLDHKYPEDVLPRAVYVASDVHTTLPEIRKNYTYPQWKVLGLETNKTYFYQWQRRSDSALKSIVQDIHFLSNCEYLVCGLSSNICRLAFEVLATKYADVWERIKPLDGDSSYMTAGGEPQNVWIPIS